MKKHENTIADGQLGSTSRPLRVCIIGSGPAGFYSADCLQKAAYDCTIDMLEALPTPYGLVRAGVAPDHQQIKVVTKLFERVASADSFRFFGNVTVGRDIDVATLRQHYDILLFCYGAASDRHLHIDGETLPGSHPATNFVGWYNAHPTFINESFDLNADTAVVIGQGNVAVDVARILARSIEELEKTDIANYALKALKSSKIKDIYMIGRRGPAQGAFNDKELHELLELKECDILVDKKDLELSAACQQELEDSSRQKRVVKALHDIANTAPTGKTKRLHIKFFQSPTAIHGDTNVTGITLGTNALTGDAGAQKATPTGKTLDLPAGLILRSIGYRGTPIPDVPFDEQKAIIPNNDGRVIGLDGAYTAGWIKRGPSGVIGTNKLDAMNTTKTITADLPDLTPCPSPDHDAMENHLKAHNIPYIRFPDWQILDQVEIKNGEANGKPREKFHTIDAMLACLEEQKNT